jgi:hypothetical protein
LKTVRDVNTPPYEPPKQLEKLSAWWQEWVEFVRVEHAADFDFDREGGEQFCWGDHLFVGCETHNNLARALRAFGRQAAGFSDGLEYHEVEDLRVWAKTKPAPLFLHEKILAEHTYIVGPSGAGKSSLGIMSLLVQLMRGAKTTDDNVGDPYPIVVLDLKGDPALFHTVRLEAERRGQRFQFFTTEKGAPTYRFNPFRGFDRGSRSVAQLCQLILDALNLNHGKGYGRSYYTERSRNVLARTLKRNRNIQSFDELHVELRETVAKADIRTKGDAFELISVIEMLTEYRQLVTNPEETIANTDGIIFMPTVLTDRQVAYFWLPAALESISVGEIAKLVLFNLRVAAQDWKRANPYDPRSVILVIDELQRVAGENLQGILQDARSFGIHAILANQSLTDLKSPTGFDLGPTVMTNTRTKFFFTSPAERECYVYVERGKGFTEARQFPQKGNPWLKDLSPEEFAYNVKLAWPFEIEEYRRREALPLPSWDEIPGGDFYTEDVPSVLEEEELPVSDVLPRKFKLIQDDEWTEQIAAIRVIFSQDPVTSAPEPIGQNLVRDLSHDDLHAMESEIAATIKDRGPERSRCVLSFLFENYRNGVESAPTWRQLWEKCWKEPLSTLRGADTQPAAKVRQTIYRLRQILAEYFESEAGRRWPQQATISLNEYCLRFLPNEPTEELPDSPFIDSTFPSAESPDEND